MTGAPPETPAAADDFLSGDAGAIFGIRAISRAVAGDALANTAALATLRPWRLRRAAQGWPRRRVLALAIERTDVPNLLAEARAELERSRHELDFVSIAAGDRGKFENLNELLRSHDPHEHDWVLLVDDDVSLPTGFLDRFLFLAERFDLRLAQPAHRRRSHAAWEVTRRRARSVARETAFVESGPLVAFHATTFETLMPFPPLKAGWGLDAHWSAVARRHGWKIGIVDATPIRHGLRLIATSYDREAAIAEGRRFLAGKPYTTAAEAQRTLVTHRRWT
jgi:hypothetical protein